ncbi:MAG TPA: YbaB/EbfC family nucleoid-associated protein [Candidatus Binataceae bacterium]|nr:YbaB/EbfC family nucleoid-associated protein [Candidatus Binataceae bacterium]
MADFNLSDLMQQAQAFQEKFKQMQEEAASKTVEAQAGGGMVKVIADGSMRIRRITIDPALIGANDKPMLEDLIVVAVNDALARAQQLVAQEMGKLGPLGGLKIPGFGGD